MMPTLSDGAPKAHWLREAEPMHRHTSLKVGGPADFYAVPRSEEELLQVLRWVKDDTLPLHITGGGTNVLVADAGVRGVVLDPRRVNQDIVRESRDDGEQWTVGAGVTTVALVRRAVEAGLKGAEVLAGVPGSVGGAVIMNAGGHDGEIKDATEAVRVVSSEGARWISAGEVGFAYRESRIAKDTVVAAVRMVLRPTDRVVLEQYVKKHMERRHVTQPLRWPNAGSFFKNPPGDFAGRLIEACELKGTRVGDAEVSSLHANFLVRSLDAKDLSEGHAGRSGSSRCRDFVSLIALVRRQVWERFAIWLELEVRPVGDFSLEERAVLFARPPEKLEAAAGGEP